MARTVFKEETCAKRLREKHLDIKTTLDVLKAAEDEWKSMSDSDKAMYFTKAENKFAEIQKIIDQNPFYPKAKSGPTKTLEAKRAERARERLFFSAYIIFLQEIFLPQQQEKHPYTFFSNGTPSDLAVWAGIVEWVTMSDNDKDMYVAEAKRRADKKNEFAKTFRRMPYGDTVLRLAEEKKRVSEFAEYVRKYKSGEPE